MKHTEEATPTVGEVVQLTKAERLAVFERDNYTCRYCEGFIEETHYWHGQAGRWIALIHVDHIIPKSKGGTNDPDNLATACRACNLRKYDRELLNGVW